GAPLFFNSKFLLEFGGSDFAARKPVLGEVFRQPDVLGAYQRALASGASSEVEADLRGPGTETERQFTVSVSPLRQGRRKIYGAIGVFHDVSKLKRADRVRIDFVANAS